MGSRPVLGAIGAFLVFFIFQLLLVHKAKQQAPNKTVRLMDLIVTSEDGCYSISRLQMYLWTVAVIMGFGAVFMYKGLYTISNIPESLYILMGVNLASTVASTAINTVKTQGKTIVPGTPNFWNDVFFESTGSLDLPRTQMFVWTIISLCVFFFQLHTLLVNGDPSLPAIPSGLVVLMGISHGAYLGGKAAKKE
jgi:hypothetical protein